MTISAEPASTGSPPSIDRVMGEPAFTAASAMIAAGRACRPIAEPTVTVVLGIRGFSSSLEMVGGGGQAAASAGSMPGCCGVALKNSLAKITATAPTIVPATSATTNHNRLPIAKNT